MQKKLSQKIHVEKGTEPFHLTYSDDQNLYISIGYGQQKTGGYSIAVDELYLTEDAIYVGTTLLGPEITGQKKGAEKPSTPYIVIKTEFLDKTVIYEGSEDIKKYHPDSTQGLENVIKCKKPYCNQEMPVGR